MPKTVREEMSDEQRRDELIAGLSATGEESVFINYSHLAQAVGEQKAESFIESMVEEQEVINPNLSPRSTLRRSLRRNAMCQVPRTDVLEACQQSKASATKKAIDAKVPPQKS